MVEFIEEWYIEQTLGEGAFGEVKLLLNKNTRDEVALKIINLDDHPEASDVVKKEVQIHKLLDHENIIRFYGSRREGPTEYLFIEYASGGELFDRIEPDVGLDGGKAQVYFMQIVNGVEYLHRMGIAHRDLKPENILLDGAGKIKISDFGFATIFRSKGQERLLDKRCGTLPYVAPEVLTRQYKAQPADIWSCGVILVALLAGELPWDRPSPDCLDYRLWKEGKHYRLPWAKLDTGALNFMKRILCPTPSRRVTIDGIRSHPWMNKRVHGCRTKMRGNGSPLAKKRASGANLRGALEDSITRICYSQPEPQNFGKEYVEEEEEAEYKNENKASFSFSQPAAAADEFFLASQIASSASSDAAPIQRLVKRMTRFCVSSSKEEALKELLEVCSENGYTCRTQTSKVPFITISTVDRRKMQLVFKASVIEMGNHLVLLDFRLSRGCGLEFKRHFVKIKEKMSSNEFKGPISWPLAVATNSIPYLMN